MWRLPRGHRTDKPEKTEKYTHEWLRRNDLKFHEFVNARVVEKSSLPLDVLVDDKLENVRDFVERDHKRWGILVDQPWNAQEDERFKTLVDKGKVRRCEDWHCVLRELERIKRLKEVMKG